MTSEHLLDMPGAWRSYASQVAANIPGFLALLDTGCAAVFPTVVIGSLLSLPHPPFTITYDQATWFASLQLVAQPVGGLLSSLVTGLYGRKISLAVVNVAFSLGWVLFIGARAIGPLYLASLVSGLGMGWAVVPAMTYCGEVSQPQIRGLLTCAADLLSVAGALLVFSLFSALPPGSIAGILLLLPAFTTLAALIIPESPQWLVHSGRLAEAEHALRWLRGQTDASQVQTELDQMYLEYQDKLPKEQTSDSNYNAASKNKLSKLKEIIAQLQSPSLYKPLVTYTLFVLFSRAAGATTVIPYMTLIVEDLQLPNGRQQIMVLIGAMVLLGDIACIFTIKFVGKRGLAWSSFLGTAVAFLFLALSRWRLIPHQLTVYFVALLSFFTGYGVLSVPMMLLSEIFPFQGRSLACGIGVSMSYIFAFIFTKTFMNLVDWFSLPVVFMSYFVIGCLGAAFVILFLPETEGKPLAEIELEFQNNTTIII